MGNIPLLLESYAQSEKEYSWWREPSCLDESLCRLASCEFCGSLFQRWCVQQIEELNSGGPDLSAISIVPAELFFEYHDVESVDLRKCARVIREKIIQAKLAKRQWFGALDFSVNERVGKIRTQKLSVHTMLITSPLTSREWNALRDCLPASSDVLRPLKESDVYDLSGISEYCAKPNFTRRVEYEDAPPSAQPFKYSLAGRHLKVLRSILSRHEHTDRIIAIGMRRVGNKMLVIK